LDTNSTQSPEKPGPAECNVCGATHTRYNRIGSGVKEIAKTCSPECAEKLAGETQRNNASSIITLATSEDALRNKAMTVVSTEQRAQVLDLVRNSNFTYRQIAAQAGTSLTQASNVIEQQCMSDPEFAQIIKARLASGCAVNARLLSDDMRQQMENGNTKGAMSLSIAAGIWLDKMTAMANNGATVVEHHHFSNANKLQDDWEKAKPAKVELL
jgi:uncharacterized protein YerC